MKELVSVSVKMDRRMQAALAKLAEIEFTSVSGIVKKAAQEFLLKHDIDWKEETE